MGPDDARRIEQILSMLAAATAGDLSVRLPTRDEGTPLVIELEYGINALLEELDLAVAERQQQREQLHAQALQLVSQQREMLMALSTPVIVVWPHVLAVPIIGEVTDERASAMCETLLAKVVSTQATHVILDLTGAGKVEAHSAESILRLARAIQLLGARCLVTGIGPDLSAVLVTLGVDWQGLPTLRSVSEALSSVLRERGVRLRA